MNKLQLSEAFLKFSERCVFKLQLLRHTGTHSTDERRIIDELKKMIEEFDPVITSIKGSVGGHSNTKPNLEQIEKHMK